MRRLAPLLGLALLVPLVASQASAACQVVSPSVSPDINYTTVCVLHEYGFGDGTQAYTYDYVLHARHAAEVDPAFTFWEAEVARGTWSYDDGDVSLQREWAQVGSGLFVGARGLIGGGYHLYLTQRDQNAPEAEGSGYCSSHVGPSTCFGGGAWLALAPVTSVGGALYYHQVNDTGACQEQAEVDLSAGGLYRPIPVPAEEQDCTVPMPWLYDLPHVWGLPPL